MRRPAAEALAAAVLAGLVTVAIALPVLRAPSERMFGAEIVGRHHDPFTVMQQFERPLAPGVYVQPVTDLAGAAIARAAGAVAAYNWLVLISFPLSAGAAYLLARHLALPPAGALLAAMLFAFSPFHIAHAAYHPHIAQTQWLPLYLLALWRCMDRAGAFEVAFLIAAALAVTMSNFYGGMIAAVITPVAMVAYWARRADLPRRDGAGGARTTAIAVTAGTLACLALAGVALTWWTVPVPIADRALLAFGRDDLVRYSTTWWGYLVPPVAHPLLGGMARRIWTASGVDVGLLEQQVSLGWGVVGLGAIAISGRLLPGGWRVNARWSRRRTGAAPSPAPRPAALVAVPMLAVIAAAALVSSLSPDWTFAGMTVPRPSALLYPFVPMFRSYARFAVVVQLMAALLAGAGASRLWSAGTTQGRTICAVLVILAAAEYAVWPPALSRDVLPTAAHRWAMRQPAASLVLDCEPMTLGSASVSWLSEGRIAPIDATAGGDCAEPQGAARISAAGFSYVIVRDAWQRQWLRDHGEAQGFHVQARFADADVFAVGFPASTIYTRHVTGFWPREHEGDTTWQWMGADASWTIMTPAAHDRVTLEVELSAFHVARPLAVRLDNGWEQTIDIGRDGRTYRIGPLALTAGPHVLTFHSPSPPTVADAVMANGDRRALSIALGAWKWSLE